MDDRIKESISALMDDETNELELQRVLSHAGEDELLETWASYHKIRAVMQSEHDEFPAIDISQSVAQIIAQEAPLKVSDDVSESSSERVDQVYSSKSLSIENELSKAAGRSRYASRISGGLAIAASVAFAFMFVLQNGVDSPLNVNNVPLAFTPSVVNESEVSRVKYVNSSSISESRQPKIIVEFSEAHARRFNEYLLRHAEHSVVSSPAGMMPLARVASVNAVGI